MIRQPALRLLQRAKASPWLGGVARLLRYGPGEQGKERQRAAKQAAREQAFHSEPWPEQEDGLVHRRYATYEAYVEHQAAKLALIGDQLAKAEPHNLAVFLERFEACPALLQARVILCLGARLGTEVKALHQLGRLAIGIDLNPGSDNRYVLPGDFNAIQFPAGSFDAVYCNTLDHLFDLGRLMGEVRRVLQPGGVFVAEAVAGFREGQLPGAFESTFWPELDVLASKIAEHGGLMPELKRDVRGFDEKPWVQLVFRKPAEPVPEIVAKGATGCRALRWPS